MACAFQQTFVQGPYSVTLAWGRRETEREEREERVRVCVKGERERERERERKCCGNGRRSEESMRCILDMSIGGRSEWRRKTER